MFLVIFNSNTKLTCIKFECKKNRIELYATNIILGRLSNIVISMFFFYHV